MEITDVQVKLVTTENGRLRAVASMVIDNAFAIHDIKIIEGSEGIFVAMPSKKIPSGEFKDIAHPINSETREIVKKFIFEAYEKALSLRDIKTE